jgi:beta-glucosidase
MSKPGVGEPRGSLEPGRSPEPGTFPDAFLWGAATSAYQIEGSPLADGAGPSTWHRFSHTPGRTHQGDTGDVACDHYRRHGEDIEWMRRLGLQAYRFSIAWGRVLPRGTGAVNPAGLGVYDRLVDQLLHAGITPFVTLYHWDLPAALDDRGGWLNPDIAGWFGEYARVLFRALGDRVRFWTTLNEPWVITDAGYLYGTHAPGHANLYEAPLASHHLLLAHAAAVRAFRAHGSGEIGIVVNLEPKDPASGNPADLEATRRSDAYMNRQYLDPLLLGAYPEEMPSLYGPAWPEFPDSEMREIRQPIDFLGVNYYKRGVVKADESAIPFGFAPVRQEGAEHTEMGWEVHPESLTRTLCWVAERYGKIPIYVTENGAAFADPPSVEGDLVDDPQRVTYLRRHLLAAREAIRRGVDLRGYFVWSLLDNFEWGSGYSVRLGLVHVDFATQKRTMKSSGVFYRRVIEGNGVAPTDGSS